MNIQSTGAEPDESCFQVEFYFDGVDRGRLSLADLTLLRRAVIAALHSERIRSAEVSVAVVSTTRMQQLNCQYLQHDYDTDVLSFCLESEEELGFLLGQLVVSLDYAHQQCEALSELQGVGVPLVHELALYLVHGSLHLTGYDDHEPEDQMEMRQRESEILQPLGIVPFWAPTADAPTIDPPSQLGQWVDAPVERPS